MTDACVLTRDALGDGPPTTWRTTAAPDSARTKADGLRMGAGQGRRQGRFP
jgi:hypothetical protein